MSKSFITIILLVYLHVHPLQMIHLFQWLFHLVMEVQALVRSQTKECLLKRRYQAHL